MILFVVFHSFLELHRLLYDGGLSCGSIKLWEVTKRDQIEKRMHGNLSAAFFFLGHVMFHVKEDAFAVLVFVLGKPGKKDK